MAAKRRLARAPHGDDRSVTATRGRRGLAERFVDACWPLTIDGMDRFPAGPAIVCANHRSFMDSVFLARAAPRPVRFLAKAEYFDRPATAHLFRAAGQIPLRRGDPTSARRALRAATSTLASGGLVGVYPEGTRSPDGSLGLGHAGPAWLSARTGAPIVPVGLIGTEHVQARGQRVPRPRRPVTIRIGPPLAPPTTTRRSVLRAHTDALMGTLAHLAADPNDPHADPDPVVVADAPASVIGAAIARMTGGTLAAVRPVAGDPDGGARRR